MRIFHLLTEGYAGLWEDPLKYRIDEAARFVHAALFLSHAIRRDTIARITFFNGPLAPLTIEISGLSVKRLYPDEQSIIGFLRRSIKKFIEGERPLPGVDVKKGWKKIEGTVLHERGAKELRGRTYFYIGGPYGFPVEPPGKRISLGDTVYTASQTVTILNYLLDVGRWTPG